LGRAGVKGDLSSPLFVRRGTRSLKEGKFGREAEEEKKNQGKNWAAAARD